MQETEIKDRDTPSQSSSDQTPTNRRWRWRLTAMGLSSVLGVALLTTFLAYREMLVWDPEDFWFRFQAAPLYLQEPGYERTGYRYLYDHRLGWRNIPHWSSRTGGAFLTINSKGLRDQESSYDKPSHVTRILVLGDSYAWGYGVSNDEIFTEVMEREYLADGQNIEVINAGVSGWGTDQEYLFWIDEGYKYDPDVVVLAFFLNNDPVNNIHARQYGLNKPLFLNTELNLANVPVPKPEITQSQVQSEIHPDDILGALDLTAAILRKLARDCESRGCDFVLMKFGAFLADDPTDVQHFETRLQTGLANTEIKYFDLDQAFANESISTLQLIEGNDDGHWNAYGHRLCADFLRDFLFREQMIRATFKPPNP